ncbi:hypothetical protein CVT25_000718 [Psilocybe cyanescens]|uniref:Proliferating cell nuclear antigen n=1 Tax=Psilocybe cyanescens TaxID=93625 RepID=A0A409XAX7_PSICY|nr:hypothetical protein CVT25_000718 [Psilocybe cyanescens]
MGNSLVVLVPVNFCAPGFTRYRCDRPLPLGVNLTSLTKVLRCAKDDDICTLKMADEAGVLNLLVGATCALFSFSYSPLLPSPLPSSPIHLTPPPLPDSDRIAEYDMKLMDIDADTLTIPETEYDTDDTLPSAEFTCIVRDLSQLGESVRIEVSKEGVLFASDSEAANGSVLLRQREADSKKWKKKANGSKPSKKAKTSPKKSSKGKSKAKSSAEDDDDDSVPAGIVIEMNQHVSLTFSKSASLSGKIAYDFTQGYIRYYLAPKIGDD